jgi:ABC-type transporter Mla subunit MlaD
MHAVSQLDTIASDNRKLHAQNRALVEQIGGIDRQRLQMAQQAEMLRDANAQAHAQIENLERRVQALKGLLEREEAFRDNFKAHEAQLIQQLGGLQDAYARSQQELFGFSQHVRSLASTIEQQRLELEQAAEQRAQLHEQ